MAMDQPKRARLAELPDTYAAYGSSGGRPAVDVYESAKTVVVCVDLPGVAREQLKVSVSGDRLVIRGERLPPSETEPRRPHRLEIAYGPFERRLAIPVPFDADRVVATLEDGILRVELTRAEPTRIRVEEG